MTEFSKSGRRAGLLVVLAAASLAWGAPATAETASASIAPHVEGLGALDPADRIAASRALGRSRAPEAVAPLARALGADPSPEVRGWVARSLAAIGTEDARAALASAAQRDADERVRGLCVQLLGQVASSPFEGQAYAAPVHQGYVDQGYRRGPMGIRRPPRRTGLGFVIAGWAAFGLTYLTAIIGGAAAYADLSDANTWPLFLPAVGPIIQAGLVFSDEPDEWGWDPTPNVFGILALVDALGQIAGITLAAIGHVRRARHRNGDNGSAEGDDEAAPVEQARRFTIGFLPSGPGNGPGFNLVGTF